MRVDVICFDAFGTLLEITDKRNPYGELFTSLGIKNAEARRLAMTMNTDILNVVKALGASEVPEAYKRKFWTDLHAEVKSIKAVPGVMDLLEQLRAEGYKLWVASNLAPPYGIAVIDGLKDAIDGCYLSYVHGAVKPEPAVFACICERLGVPANKVLMIGDNPKNDIEGARHVGMQAELVPSAGITLAWLHEVLGLRNEIMDKTEINPF